MGQKAIYTIFFVLISASSIVFLNVKKISKTPSSNKLIKKFRSPYAGRRCNPAKHSYLFHQKSQTFNICAPIKQSPLSEGKDKAYDDLKKEKTLPLYYWTQIPNYVQHIRPVDLSWERDPQKDKCLLRSYELKEEHYNNSDYQKAFFDRTKFYNDFWKPDHLGHNRNSLAYHEDKGSERSRFPRLTGTLRAKVFFYIDKNFKEKVEEYFKEELKEYYEENTTPDNEKIKASSFSAEIIENVKAYLNGDIDKQTFKSSIPEEVRFNDYLDFWELIGFYEQYFQSQSFGRMKYQVDRRPIIVDIDRDGEDDKYKLTKIVMEKVPAEAKAEFESNFDFGILVGVGVKSGDQRSPTGYSFINDYGDKNPVEHLGTTITNFTLVNWRFNSKFSREYYVLPHESMHMHGLPDFYYKSTYDDLPTWRMTRGYDLMYDSVGSGINGYAKWVYGWIPDSQVECVDYMSLPLWNKRDKSASSEGDRFNISHLNSLEYMFQNNPHKKLIVIKGKSNRHAIVIERRGPSWGDYDIVEDNDNINPYSEEGVIVYSVDSLSVTSHHVNRPVYLAGKSIKKRVNRTAPPLMLARTDWSTVNKKLYLYKEREALRYILRRFPQYEEPIHHCMNLVHDRFELDESRFARRTSPMNLLIRLLEIEEPLNKKHINKPRFATDCINSRTSNVFHRLIEIKDNLYDKVWDDAYITPGEVLENYPIRVQNITESDSQNNVMLKIWRTRENQNRRDRTIKFLDF